MAHRLLSLLAAALLSGCGLMALYENSTAYLASTTLLGRVSGAVPAGAPVIVAAYQRRSDALEVADRERLPGLGAYELVVPRGEYSLFAFADANRNLRYDAGEAAGDYAGGAPVEAGGGGPIALLDIALSSPPSARVPTGTDFAPAAGEPRSTPAGAVVSLEDRRFAATVADSGYWAPMQFQRDPGANLVFLEPYDAAKIPVLFVHGAAGSPRDWAYLAKGLDRARYQPWFYYYPSGAPVGPMADLLMWKLYDLQARHGFRRLHLVAHSAGGLVARAFLARHGANFPYVKLFVSISTPWGGETLAAFGVHGLPASVPLWNDLQPRSAFLRSLFERKLPPGAEFYLLFGHGGGGGYFRPNNDGTVTLASQLAPAAQAEARMVYGYDETHESILYAAPVRAQLNALLASADAPNGEPPREGRVRVEFRYAGEGGAPRAQPLLVLAPADGRRARITLPLNPEDSGREVGPIPAGAYDASLVAYAHRGEPAVVPLRVGDGRSTTLGFRLLPEGVVAGTLAETPAGHIPLESVTLSGEGVRRTLAPEMGADPLAKFLAGHDHAEDAYFWFVGLEKGNYEITVRAKGYHPYVQRHHVIPGRYGPLRPIVLTPLP
ncbi:MAG: alpha/beta fold hydrolase [Burkholderiales bacterium]